MEREKLLKADYLDIIFDRRNKAYGGYELRKNYSRRTRNASSIVLFAAAVGFAIPALAGMLKKPVAMLPRPVVKTPVILHPTELAKPVKPVETPPAPPKPLASVKITPPVITPNDQVRPEDVLQPNDKLHDKQISDVNQAGAAVTTDISMPANPNPTGAAAGTGVIEAGSTAKSDKPFIYVEQMPVFSDMDGYLRSHTTYPPAARENNVQGRVVVQFVVNEDGSISDAVIVKSAAPDLDNEALRVVRSMPHWKPGKQNGVPVKVYFKIPVNFELN